MSEKIKPVNAQAEAARQELFAMRQKLAKKEAEYAQFEQWGAYDDEQPEADNLTYQQYLDQRPATAGVTRGNHGQYRDGQTGQFISQAEYTGRQTSPADHYYDLMENDDSNSDYKNLDIEELISLYAQAEVANDRTIASDTLGAIDDMVAGYKTKYQLDKQQVDELYDEIMDKAEVEAYGESKIDTLEDINGDDQSNKVDDLSDLLEDDKASNQPEETVSAPEAGDKVDDLADLADSQEQVDDLSSIAEAGEVDDLSDLAEDDRADDLADTADGKNRLKKSGNFLKDSGYKAAAVLSVGIFRAGQWLGRQRIKESESQTDFERRRNNNTGQKIAVGAVAVGAAVAWWYYAGKHGDSGDSNWFNNLFGDNHNEGSPTPAETPHDGGSTEIPLTSDDFSGHSGEYGSANQPMPSVEPSETSGSDASSTGAEAYDGYVPEFSYEAYTVDRGEGWYQTFQDMGIPSSEWNDLLDKVGPTLHEQGYAYHLPESKGNWGISDPGRLPSSVLEYIWKNR